MATIRLTATIKPLFIPLRGKQIPNYHNQKTFPRERQWALTHCNQKSFSTKKALGSNPSLPKPHLWVGQWARGKVFKHHSCHRKITYLEYGKTSVGGILQIVQPKESILQTSKRGTLRMVQLKVSILKNTKGGTLQMILPKASILKTSKGGAFYMFQPNTKHQVILCKASEREKIRYHIICVKKSYKVRTIEVTILFITYKILPAKGTQNYITFYKRTRFKDRMTPLNGQTPLFAFVIVLLPSFIPCRERKKGERKEEGQYLCLSDGSQMQLKTLKNQIPSSPESSHSSIRKRWAKNKLKRWKSSLDDQTKATSRRMLRTLHHSRSSVESHLSLKKQHGKGLLPKAMPRTFIMAPLKRH